MDRYPLVYKSGAWTSTGGTYFTFSNRQPHIYKKDEVIYVPIDHPDYINLVRRRLADRARKLGDL